MTIPADEPRPGPDLRLFPAAAAAWAFTWWATGERARLVLISAGLAAALVGGLLGVLALAGGARSREQPRWLAWLTAVTLIAAVVAAVLAGTGVRLLGRERDPLTMSATAHLTGSFSGRVVGDPRQLASKSPSGSVAPAA